MSSSRVERTSQGCTRSARFRYSGPARESLSLHPRDRDSSLNTIGVRSNTPRDTPSIGILRYLARNGTRSESGTGLCGQSALVTSNG